MVAAGCWAAAAALMHLLAVCASGGAYAAQGPPPNEALVRAVKTDDFVWRDGTRLLLHGRPFRFGAANLPGLGMAEQPALGFPSRFRIDDSLRTAALMGARVVRSHTLGISTGHAYSFWCNGTFNYSALQTIDYAVWRAD